ncbi:hypothetical protein BDZ91DRAFT_848882 [Kalaharituber pfeilii]|nr:hypothetical protein BDZ91DRAFT_848882 [Kalaharituber pfeilii]
MCPTGCSDPINRDYCFDQCLQQLIKFLTKEDIKGDFRETSALRCVIGFDPTLITDTNSELLSKTSQEMKATLLNQKKQIDSILPLCKDTSAMTPKMSATLDHILSFISEIDKLALDVQEIKRGVQSLHRNIDHEYTEKLLA